MTDGGRVLKIPKNTLKPMTTYNFGVTLKFTSTNELIKTTSFSITGAPIKVKAIVYPVAQLVTENTVLEINGFYESSTTKALSYQWTCKSTINEYCTFKSGLKVPVYNSKDLIISTSFAAGSDIIWTLAITNGNEILSRASARVLVEEPGAPVISIQGISKSVQATDILFVQAISKNENIADYLFKWRIEGNDELKYPTNDFISIDVSKIRLTEESTFTLLVDVKNPSTGKTGELKLEVQVESLPEIKELTCNTNEGYSWYTRFIFEAITNTPNKVYYEFVYYNQEKQKFVPLTIKNEQARLETVLPTGIANKAHELEVGVKVYNEKGGWVQKNVKVKSRERVTNALSLIGKYYLINSMKDLRNSLNILERDLLISYAISETPAIPYKTYENDTVCNQQELWLHMDCIRKIVTDRYEIYGEVGNEYLEKILVSDKLINNILYMNEYEHSIQSYQAIAQIIINIAKDETILTETSRHYARILLSQTISKGIISDYNEFATALNNLAVLSTDSKRQEDEFKLMKSLIAWLIEGESEISIRGGEDFFVKHDLVNYRVDATVVQGSYDMEIKLGRVTFPRPNTFLDRNNYLYLSVIEWRIPSYSWAKDITNIQSKVFTIFAKHLNGSYAELTELNTPVTIEFPLELNKITAKELNILRCLYFNKKTKLFSIEGLNSIIINIKTAIGTCRTFHLSDFTIGTFTKSEAVFPFPKNREIIIEEDTNKLHAIHKSPLFYFTVALVIMFLYLLLWGYCKEKAELELALFMKSKLYLKQKETLQDGPLANTKKAPKEIELKTLTNQSYADSVNESKVEDIKLFHDPKIINKDLKKAETFSQDEIKVAETQKSEVTEPQINAEQIIDLKRKGFCTLFLVLSLHHL